jgi:hypothetical protein
MGANLASCQLIVGQNGVDSLEVTPDGNWVLVNGVRIIPREMLYHGDVEPLVTTFADSPRVICGSCGVTFDNKQALGGHRRHCMGAVEPLRAGPT